MNPNVIPPCPFDWQDGPNEALEGGFVWAEEEHTFVYATPHEQTGISGALIIPKLHIGPSEMPRIVWGEMGDHFTALCREFGHHIRARNLSLNDGFVAGERVAGHAHVHYIPRWSELPSSTWGLKALMSKYDAQTLALRAILATCEHEPTRRALEELLQK